MDNELSRFVDALPGLVWTALPDGHVDFLNRRWCEYTGLGLQEASGSGWQSVVHPEDLPELLRRWRAIVASGEAGEMEARMRRRDGVYRWFLISTNPRRNEAGQVIQWSGLNTDVEERKRVEQALQLRELDARTRAERSLPSSEYDLGAIIDAIPMTAWSTGADDTATSSTSAGSSMRACR
jgi:PAS domain S-box-containing protein